MTKQLRKAHMLLVLTLLIIAGASQNIWAQISITDGTKYTQDFNSLASAGTSNAWTDNSSISGWYSTRTIYHAGTGSSTAGALYSFGTNTDRAIGSINSNAIGAIAYGVQFKNDANKKVTSVRIKYTGEQWRYVHYTTQDGTPILNPQSLEFMYSVSETAVSSISNTSNDFTIVSALKFESPIYTTTTTTETTSKALDGNLDANKATLEHTFNVDITPGQYLIIKWLDANDPGSDHGLAIDDFELEFIYAAQDITPPSAISYSPAVGSTNVATNSNLSITFDEVITKGTGNIELYNADDGSILQEIDVTTNAVSISENVVTINVNLQPATNYYVHVSPTAFKDVSGNHFEETSLNNKWIFTTAATATPVLASSAENLYFGYVLPNETKILSFVVSGTDISNDISLFANSTFTLSTEEAGTYSASLTLTAAEVVSGKTIYVKFSPTAEIQSSGLITISSAGASTVEVKVLGTALNGYAQNFDACTTTGNNIAGGWVRLSEQGDQVWDCTSFGLNNTSGLQINGFSGSARDNIDYLISPSLDLSNLNVPIVSFWTKSEFSGPSLEVKISTNYDGISNPNTATWISLPADLPAVNSRVWKQSIVNLSEYKLPNVHIAFVYTSSTSAGASRWSVDEFAVNTNSYFLTTSNLDHSFGITAANTESASKSFDFSILGLEQDLTVSVPEHFEISKDGNVFGQSVIYSKEAATSNNTFFVRFTPTAEEFILSGAITFSSGNQLDLTKGSLVGSSKTKSSTLDVVTWNVEWFGADKDANGAELGPADEDLQFANVKNKLLALDADIYALQEIADDAQMERLVSELPGYSFVKSDVYSYSIRPSTSPMTGQKLYFVYKTSTVKVKSQKVLLESLYRELLANTKVLEGYNPTATGEDATKDDAFWSSGRLPYMVEFEATIDGVRQNVHLLNVHARANSGNDIARYNMRKYDLQVLKDTLDAHYPNVNLIMLGDYNDDVDVSVVNNLASTYKPFVDDIRYSVLTYDLSTTGVGTYQASSFLDHITISKALLDNYVTGSVQIENSVANQIPNYFTTTSDHLSVSARFVLAKDNQTITFGELAEKTYGDEVFELSATSSSGLPVTYTSSDETVAKIVEGNKVEILKAGTATITASQEGDEGYNAAAPVTQTLTINKAAQTITFADLSTKTLGDAAFELTASSSSQLAVTYVIESGLATLENNILTITGAGEVIVKANQAGNENYLAATSIVKSFCVNPAKPVITINGAELSANVQNGVTAYQWYLDGTAIADAVEATYEATEIGTYTVVAKAGTCTSVASEGQVFTVTAARKAVAKNAKVSVYPNPTTGSVTIVPSYVPEGRSITARLSSIEGKQLIQTADNVSNVNEDINTALQKASAGVYVLQLNINGETSVIKIVKQ